MTRRKREMTSACLERTFPHQVAVRASNCGGKNTDVVREFCRNLSVAPRGHSVVKNEEWYKVFCFADPTHADMFLSRFEGEHFDPKLRGRGPSWMKWREEKV
jgi:hypothetical protein